MGAYSRSKRLLMNKPDASLKIVSVAFTKAFLEVRFSNGRVVRNPLKWYPRLMHASAEERNAFEISGGGYGAHWAHLDEDLSATGISQGIPSVEYRAS